MSDKAVRVFVIGDSISMHYGPLLAMLLGSDYLVDRLREGVGPFSDLSAPESNGGDSANVLTGVERLVGYADAVPDVLLLNCGLHDIKTDLQSGARQVPLEDYEIHLRKTVSLLRGAGMRVVWLRTTPVNDQQHNEREGITFHRFARDVYAYNQVADAVMAEAGFGVVDLHGFTERLGGREVFCDHVHFTENVRRLQAAFLAGVVTTLSGGHE